MTIKLFTAAPGFPYCRGGGGVNNEESASLVCCDFKFIEHRVA